MRAPHGLLVASISTDKGVGPIPGLRHVTSNHMISFGATLEASLAWFRDSKEFECLLHY